MLRALLIFIIFLIIFAGIVLFVLQAPGQAILTYGDTTIELPLVGFVIGIFIVFVLLYLLLRLLNLIIHMPRRIHAARARHRQRASEQDTRKGLTRFVSGDWARSEKLLARAAEHANHPFIHYLLAAQAAKLSGNDESLNHYLEQAEKCMPAKQRAALDILHAEILLQQGQPEQALSCIVPHCEELRSNSKVAGLLAGAYDQLQDWQQLARILPDLKKNPCFDRTELEILQNKTVHGLLAAVRNGNTAEDAEKLGTRYKEVIMNNDNLAVAYVETLLDQDRLGPAAALSLEILGHHWNAGLARLYGLMKHADVNRALHQAEQWTGQHDEDPVLYLTLGRLCKQAQLWGKAKSYLEQSLIRKPFAETYAELAELHEHLDESEAAQHCSKKGLLLATRATQA